MNLDRLSVYWVKIPDSTSATTLIGGEIEMSDDIRSIFEASFLGNEKGGPKKQPFHFNLSGAIRNNSSRDRILRLLDDPDGDIQKPSFEFALELQKVIDDRTGDLLLAIGLGWSLKSKRCVLWAFPSDTPIQLQSSNGKTIIKEIEHAFTKKSKYRKAIYFEGPISPARNDFLRGELIDSTRQGISRSVAQYWVERFLHGQIALSGAQGVKYLIQGIRRAQKYCTTPEEHASVFAAYSRLMSGALNNTTLSQFSYSLKGDAKKAYLQAIPKTIEKDAVFDIVSKEVKKQIKKIIYILENGISVLFPTDGEIEPKDYIKETENGRLLSIQSIIKIEKI